MMTKKQKKEMDDAILELQVRCDALEEEVEKLIKSLNSLANRFFAHERQKDELRNSKTLGDTE